MNRIAALLVVVFAVMDLSGGELWDEYGDLSEVKGLTKVYVDTGEFLEIRKLIIGEFKSAIPDIVVTAGPDEAEFALVFVPRVEGDDMRTTLYVLRPVGDKVRLLERYTDGSTHTGTTGFARTSRVLTKKFITAYRQANR